MHFVNMWLSGIITITNSNSDSASPWKIFTSVSFLPPVVISTLQFYMVFSINFMISQNIFDILWLSIVQVCRTIIIIFIYLKPYNCLLTNDYYQIEIVTWNHIIVYKLLIFHTNILKPYNCAQIVLGILYIITVCKQTITNIYIKNAVKNKCNGTYDGKWSYGYNLKFTNESNFSLE